MARSFENRFFSRSYIYNLPGGTISRRVVATSVERSGTGNRCNAYQNAVNAGNAILPLINWITPMPTRHVNMTGRQLRTAMKAPCGFRTRVCPLDRAPCTVEGFSANREGVEEFCPAFCPAL